MQIFSNENQDDYTRRPGKAFTKSRQLYLGFAPKL